MIHSEQKLVGLLFQCGPTGRTGLWRTRVRPGSFWEGSMLVEATALCAARCSPFSARLAQPSLFQRLLRPLCPGRCALARHDEPHKLLLFSVLPTSGSVDFSPSSSHLPDSGPYREVSLSCSLKTLSPSVRGRSRPSCATAICAKACALGLAGDMEERKPSSALQEGKPSSPHLVPLSLTGSPGSG